MNNHHHRSRNSHSVAPLPSGKALDAYFLEARSKILDVAAFLDRVGRGDGSVEGDARLAKIDDAVRALLEPSGGRAERIQQIFSLDYDPAWERPTPSGGR